MNAYIHARTDACTHRNTHTSTYSFFILMQTKHVLRLQIAGSEGETQMEGRLTDDRQTEGRINRETYSNTDRQASSRQPDREAGR